ncbi:MAG: GerMN domain-containing protein [Acidimicrobiales bacterium]
MPAVLAAILAVVALALSGCGISAESSARAIPSSKVPFNLLSNQPPSSTTTTSPNYATTITVYFTVTFSRYVSPVSRQVAKATITSILTVLLAGPSPVQKSNGYQSAFTRSGVRLIRASIAGGVATVDFNKAFGQTSGSLQVLAPAQVIYTLTVNFKTVTKVKFQIDGTTLAVPTPVGGLTPTPVGTSQYQTLLAPGTASPRTTTTTTTTTPGA